MTAMREERISYYSDGLRITGDLRFPDSGSGRWPAVVCCHGYSGNPNSHTAGAARALTEAGYLTLTIAHRGFWDSEGPRGRMIPMEQVHDIIDALSYLESRDDVDAGLLGLWGQSFGGSNVTYAAAIDPRVRCMVSLSGIGNGRRWLRSLRPWWQWLELLDRLKEDRVRRATTGESEIVDFFDLMPCDPMNTSYLRGREADFPGWVWQRPLETAQATIDYAPEDVADRISPRAALWIHTELDQIVPVEESVAMYERAKEPKKLVVMRHRGAHYDAYAGEFHDEIMRIAIDWFRQHMSPPAFPSLNAMAIADANAIS